MMVNQNLTYYQQSLIEMPEKNALSTFVKRVASIIAVLLLSAGFLYRHYEKIPSMFDGWLVLGAFVYICLNWFGVFIGLFLNLTLISIKFFYSQASTISPSREDKEILEYKIRKLIVSFAKNVNLLNALSISFTLFFDIVADWLLFVALATTNHPYLASLHAASLIFQYLIVLSARNNFKKIIVLLPDPLEESSKTDIDKLMDDLCNPGEQDLK